MSISRLSYSLDEDYPKINWGRYSGMSDLWLEIDDTYKAGKDIGLLLGRIEYKVRIPKRWHRIDFVSMCPGLGISSRAKAVFDALDVPGLQYLQFTLNNEPFYLFYTNRRVDCLDKERSSITYFSPSNDRVMSVEKYVFKHELLQDVDIFTVSELSAGMFFWSQSTFATDSARRSVMTSDLIGYNFEQLPN